MRLCHISRNVLGVTRWVKSLGVDINESGTDLTQELILMKHLDNLFLNDETISDRTLIDCFYLHRMDV